MTRRDSNQFANVDLSPQTYHSFNGGDGGESGSDNYHNSSRLPKFTQFQRTYLYPLTRWWLFDFSSKEDNTRTNLDSWLKRHTPRARIACKQILVSVFCLFLLYLFIYHWAGGGGAGGTADEGFRKRVTHHHKHGVEYMEFVPQSRELYSREVRAMNLAVPYRDVTQSEIDAQHADVRLPWHNSASSAVATINFTLAEQVMKRDVDNGDLLLLCTGLPHFGVPLRVFYTAEEDIMLRPVIDALGPVVTTSGVTTPLGTYYDVQVPSWVRVEYTRLDTGRRKRATLRGSVGACVYTLMKEADGELATTKTYGPIPLSDRL